MFIVSHRLSVLIWVRCLVTGKLTERIVLIILYSVELWVPVIIFFTILSFTINARYLTLLAIVREATSLARLVDCSCSMTFFVTVTFVLITELHGMVIRCPVLIALKTWYGPAENVLIAQEGVTWGVCTRSSVSERIWGKFFSHRCCHCQILVGHDAVKHWANRGRSIQVVG